VVTFFLPIWSQRKARKLKKPAPLSSSAMTLSTDTGLSKDSKAMAQQVRTLDKGRLAKSVAGHVPADLMTQVDAALRLHLSL
jgi:mRNA-degrading endonuclease toxin of MazEF toxin-antitoxin module